MGYHANVAAALVDLLEAGLPGIMILNGLAVEEADASRFSESVLIVREEIRFDPHVEINPSTTASTQEEEWLWVLYVTGGGGQPDRPERGAEVDLLLETLRTTLNAQRLTSDCGPLSLTSEKFLGPHGTGVMYAQRWRHIRVG